MKCSTYSTQLPDLNSYVKQTEIKASDNSHHLSQDSTLICYINSYNQT